MEIDKNSEFFKNLQAIAIGLHNVVKPIAIGLHNVVIPIAIEIQKKINEIDPEKLKSLIEGIERFQRNEPYLNKLANELKANNNLTHTNEVLSLVHFMQLIYENEENPQDIDILDIINTNYFNHAFFSQFENIKMGDNFANRKDVLKEAFKLYELGFYAGCLSLLYVQLEGVLTDYLLYKGVLVKKEKDYEYVGEPIARVHTKKKITGIFDKIKIAKNVNKYFETLDAYKIDNSYKINNDRNDILHGNILDRFTKERCFIVIIWLVSIFNFFECEYYNAHKQVIK